MWSYILLLENLIVPEPWGKLDSFKIFQPMLEISQFQDLLFMTWPPWRTEIWSARKTLLFTFSGLSHMEKPKLWYLF